MPEILIPQRWTSQPQYPVEIDLSNSICNGMIMAIIPGIGDVLSANKAPTFVGTGSVEPRSAGKAASSKAGGINYVEYPCNINASGNRTLAVYASNVGDGDSINTHYITDADSSDALRIGPNLFIGQIDNNTAASISITPSVAPRVYGARRVSNQVSGFVNSTITGNSVTGTRALTGVTAFRFGRDGAQNNISCDTFLACYWNRALSDAEIVAFSRNPWQIFRPQTRRIFFDVGAGGPATHTNTGSLASQSAAIAGTATHKTLHATSGALASQSAVIAGSATRVAGFVTHTTSGALSAASATVSGTAVHPHVTSGALAAQSAIIVGVAERSVAGTHDTTGALASDSAVITGTAAHIAIHATSGALSAQSAVISGTSVKTSAGTGTGATVEEIWAYEIEPGVTAKMALQRLLAVMGGKVSGAGSGTETFRDINDTRDALISTNDSNGNRTGLTWNDGP